MRKFIGPNPINSFMTNCSTPRKSASLAPSFSLLCLCLFFRTILISFISISKSISFHYFALFNILRSFCFSFSLLYLHLLYLFYHLYFILFLYHILLLPHLLNPLHLLGLSRIPHLLNYTTCICDPNSSFLYLIISC